MTERDPSLDMALRLLASGDSGGGDDDARFLERVSAALGQKKFDRKDLDAVLEAPLPDDHRDPVPVARRAVEEADVVEEPDAALAAEDRHGDDRSWEGAMSSAGSGVSTTKSGPMSTLDPLAALTRSATTSGSHTSLRPEDIGAAKGPDSGLIDLRGLSQSGEKPIAAAPSEKSIALAKTTAAAPAANKAGVSAPPATSTSAHATSHRAAPSAPARSTTKSKQTPLIWIGGAGFAAAAALAIFFVSTRGSKAPTDSQRSMDVAAAKANASNPEPVPAASIAATTAAAPTILASASASTAPDDVPNTDDQTVAQNDDNAVNAKKPPAVYAPPTKATGGGGTNVATGKEKPAPTATATGTPPPGDKKNGSLDDVLGLSNKPTVPTANVSVTPDLPDKPEQIDIRSAVNGKLGAASGCVKGLDGPSSVQVQFSPGGTVASVVVTSGPAKGTGAEACIKSAFASAKVPRSKMGGTGFAKLTP